MKLRLLLIVLPFIFCASLFADESKDHPLIGRLKGSEVFHQEIINFDQYKLATGGAADEQIGSVARIEGKITTTIYSGIPANSAYEIYSAYNKYFEGENYEILFSCSKAECGKNFAGTLYDLNPLKHNPGWNNSAPLTQGSMDFEYYIAAKSKRPGKDIYVNLFVTQGWWQHPVYKIDVVEAQSLTAEIETPEQMNNDLKSKGHIAIYGIFFDTGKAVIKPESSKAVETIARLLKQTKDLNLYIVGHTDDSGNFQSNMQLSIERADAVAKILNKKYGIGSQRLLPHGVGPLVPVASNITADGRALNRRVELVQNTGKTLSGQAKTTGSGFPEGVPVFEIKVEASQAAQSDQGQSNSASTTQSAAEASPAPTPPPPLPEEKLVPVPSVIGKFKVGARNILEQTGFTIKVRGKKVGRVTSQSPTANTMVKPGSLVTITVGK